MSTPTPSLQHEVLAVSPATPVSGCDSPSKKRKITPSTEASASKRCLLVSPVGYVSPDNRSVNLRSSPIFPAFRYIFPSGEADISAWSTLTTHAHPEPLDTPESSLPEPLQHPRHIILPFNLRLNPKEFHIPENRRMIWELFREVRNISFDDRFLRFELKELPAKPWPRTIAGVPPYLTTNPADEGPVPPIRRTSNSLIKIARDIDCRNDNSKIDKVFNILKDYFAKLQTEITQLQYWENFVVIVLKESNADLADVPRSAAMCPCYYLYDYELGRPTNYPAQRNKEPSKDVVDDSCYDTLRPGVMLSSGKHPAKDLELRTTSGVLINDCTKNRYLTVASQGFPFGTSVYHPTAAGREIGQVVNKLTHTDVALVKLRDGVDFENETFENAFLEATPVRLKKFVRAADESMRIGDTVFMNSPFTGYGEGTYGPYTEDRIPSDDPQQPMQLWIKARWVYLGQNAADEPVDGACGSAIWNIDGNVVGFFRYAPQSGHFRDWSLTVAADHLVERGYSVI